jgi:ferredoxin
MWPSGALLTRLLSVRLVSGCTTTRMTRTATQRANIAALLRRSRYLALTPARSVSLTAKLDHGDDELKDVPETIQVTFVTKDGQEEKVMAKEGERALYLAHRKGIDMEGACEASLACTTCHCYVEGQQEDGQDFFDALPEATETEEDLLDMAPFLSVNSRLGCQVILRPELNGIVLRLPRATKNFYVDGHKPQPH